MLILFLALLAEPVPAGKATVDAFMSAVPPASGKSIDDKVWLISDEALAELKRKNPGRDVELQKLVASYNACHDNYALDRLRAAAARIGDEKLRRLTEFYRSADFKESKKLEKRDPTSFSTDERVMWERIQRDYPIDEFMASFKLEFAEMNGEAVLKAWSACTADLADQMKRRSLKH